MYKLSVLIPTVPTRTENFLPKILSELSRQCADRPVEVVYLGDFFNMPVGAKRNHLLRMATGQYAVFVDDDDTISEHYISRILDATNSYSDAIVFDAEITINGGPPTLVRYSKDLEHGFRDGVYERKPNHLMPFKSELAKSILFPEINVGEDSIWADRMTAIIKTEVHIPEVLYHYAFNTETTEAQKAR